MHKHTPSPTSLRSLHTQLVPLTKGIDLPPGTGHHVKLLGSTHGVHGLGTRYDARVHFAVEGSKSALQGGCVGWGAAWHWRWCPANNSTHTHRLLQEPVTQGCLIDHVHVVSLDTHHTHTACTQHAHAHSTLHAHIHAMLRPIRFIRFQRPKPGARGKREQTSTHTCTLQMPPPPQKKKKKKKSATPVCTGL